MSKKEVRRRFSFLITVLAGGSLSLLFRQLKNHKIDVRYSGRVIGTIIVCMILEPFRWWEELRWHQKIKNTRITKSPVFIIGFWRSGTTLLHNLMTRMPDASYVTTYQTVFPNLLLSHSWWFKPIIGRFWPTHRPFDDVKMSMDLPQEEEIALANLQDISFYNFLYFPKDFDRFYNKQLFIRGIQDKLIRKWKTNYIKMMKKACINVGGDRLISKSPSNMARISLILDMFPDAKFIFLYRDPYKTVESFYRFFQEVLPVVQVQNAHEFLTRERLIRVYADMIRQYFADKNKIPEKNLIEIKFEDFKKDPIKDLRLIFERFEIPGFEEALPGFEKYLESQDGFTPTKYEITGETIECVNKYAGDLVDKLKYPHRN